MFLLVALFGSIVDFIVAVSPTVKFKVVLSSKSPVTLVSFVTTFTFFVIFSFPLVNVISVLPSFNTK